MKTYTITFLKSDDTHQTVKIKDIDRLAAQMTAIIKFNCRQIVKVTE